MPQNGAVFESAPKAWVLNAHIWNISPVACVSDSSLI